MFKEKINMVHLNLAIALLLGLIVFVSGVETAKDNEVGMLTYILMYSKEFSIGWVYIGHFTYALLFPGCLCLVVM